MLIGTSTIRVENNQLIGVVRFEVEINPIEGLAKKYKPEHFAWLQIGANPRAGRWGERAGENPEAIYFY
jgi:hypothetical protein